ncbi:hypothetical protein BHYA_0092g00470 [Botrytis hyacinthi]|uniref:Uncharacterized protein n=1 Tax=Botrytis hyacinthi TaxID=278943 RepID=A0A4Z1GL81_9HELO|nr:hypothetical protein BHYA_0092g00470 [Botrytis hyacinthi]
MGKPVKGEFLKSDFYTVNDTKVGKAIIKNAFSTQSNEVHAQMLRPIQKFYNMGNVLSLEKSVDDTIAAFFKRLNELFVDDSNAGTIPALDHWLGKNPITPIGPPTFDKAAIWCAQQSIARQQGMDEKSTDRKDMLDSFIEVKKTNPELMDDNAIVGSLLLNVLAGADTSAIVLRSIIYFTIKNHRVHQKLIRELDSANLSVPVAYKEVSKLPYLEAVIREASRVHAGVGLLLERIVPASGLTLSDGTFLPPGTIVGINPWVTNQNKKVYGEDSSSFVPERWLRYNDLETEAEYQSRLSMMRQTDLSFGAGNRICLGKNISTLSIYKLVASLFLTYNICLVDPEKEWQLQNSWFVRQTVREQLGGHILGAV